MKPNKKPWNTDCRHYLYLCQQFRYIFQDYTLGIPRGFIADGEIAYQAAERELKGEAGVRTRKCYLR